MHLDLLQHNREAWNREAERGNTWTRPVSSEVVQRARKGEHHLLLTPTIPAPRDWIGDVAGKRVLCLASGGGQQVPVFAALGADVTVLDNSPAQLESDRAVCEREGLPVRLEQGDMRDLSRFADGSFDLVFHPVSNCFVDTVLPVWRECARVLREGGELLAGFANPLIYIFDFKEWDRGSLVVRHSVPYADTGQLSPEELASRIENKEPLEYGHTLEDQLRGQLQAGLLIRDLYEDKSGGDLLDAHIPTFMATRAVKHPQ